MALIGPILDNRTQQQLRDELVRRIPAYSPDWTDHNETDPGIVLRRPAGAFYMIVKMAGVKDSDDFARWLLDDFTLDGETVMVQKKA